MSKSDFLEKLPEELYKDVDVEMAGLMTIAHPHELNHLRN